MVTHQADNNKDANSEEKHKYCRCEQSVIDELLCEECNLHGEQAFKAHSHRGEATRFLDVCHLFFKIFFACRTIYFAFVPTFAWCEQVLK